MFGTNGADDQQAVDAVTFTQPTTSTDTNNDGGFTMTPVAPNPVNPDPTTAPVESSAPASVTPAVTNGDNNDDLLNIKQEALQQLTPLVSHLDQSAEEKFKTIMMMIQATDDHTKLKEAFDAAKEITDDKVRAQALLDVVNEINYFTQQHNS